MAKDNLRQQRIQALIEFFCSAIAEDKQNGTDFDCAVIYELEMLKNQFADDPAKDFKMTKELNELGFHPPGTKGICGCSTIPCFGGKMPYQSQPMTPCAIGQTMCDESPIQSMRQAKAFKDMEAQLKEEKRLAKNKAARERYAAKKTGGLKK